jgi:sugar O-acyltransferase (sialic acid O-acetyltransferase NeuD family)
MKKNIFLIGGGGHCISCIDVIESSGLYAIKGIFDTQENCGKKILGYPIIGTDADIIKSVSNENYFLITIGQIKSAERRQTLAIQLDQLKAKLATVTSARAYVSGHAQIGEGTIVMHDAIVNANAKVGRHCILNTKSLIEHDAIIEDHCHISTGAIVNGNSVVKAASFVGSLAVIKHSVTVPQKTLVQAGHFYDGK